MISHARLDEIERRLGASRHAGSELSSSARRVERSLASCSGSWNLEDIRECYGESHDELRVKLFTAARNRRRQRLAGFQRGDNFLAIVAEVLSYQPDEEPDPSLIMEIEDASRDPATRAFACEAMLLLQTRDGFGLRRQIWEPPPVTSRVTDPNHGADEPQTIASMRAKLEAQRANRE